MRNPRSVSDSDIADNCGILARRVGTWATSVRSIIARLASHCTPSGLVLVAAPLASPRERQLR